MSAAKTAKNSPKRSGASGGNAGSLSAEEKAALKEAIRERKANATREEAAAAVAAAIEKMSEPDRVLARRIHEMVAAAAPALSPKTFYGMPAYANAEGKVICFFQAASKFKVRYSTFGFQPEANLDEGDCWAASFALIRWNPEIEAMLAALVKRAVRPFGS
jgi:uncharacterized protein YdhG (YjbR/CyaY superfamily)